MVLPHLPGPAWRAHNWSQGNSLLAGKPAGYYSTRELFGMDREALLQELDELMAAFQAWLHKMVHMLAHEDDNQGN